MTVLTLRWMRDDAPYMPIASIGLLAVLEPVDPDARLRWHPDDAVLELHTTLELAAVGEAVASAALPDPARVDWPTRNPQALGPSLASTEDPVGTYRRLLAEAAPLEARLLRALATDQAATDAGVPLRTRLLRGAKSDLSAFGPLRRATAEQLTVELGDGPVFAPGKSGTGLGLVPEVQTFGGTTGREASQVGAESALLSRLLRHGILALPPTGCLRRGRRDVGGPLLSDERDLSWPRWTVPCDRRSLRVLFGLACVHAVKPDVHALAGAGIDAVFRSTPQQLSTTVAVFRWGRRMR